MMRWSDFLDATQHRLVLRELVRFLLLKVEAGDYDGSALSPSGAVDVAWHAILLFPKQYATVCLALHKCRPGFSAEKYIDAIFDHNPLISRKNVSTDLRALAPAPTTASAIPYASAAAHHRTPSESCCTPACVVLRFQHKNLMRAISNRIRSL
eukprot:SAG11_NODE_275_length_11309_cov_6.090901_2_plen_153_part_00